MDIKVIIATHKKADLPNDDIYLPLQVGSEGKKDIGYTMDNTGDNISKKNPLYCELTGLYWGWKNLKCDYCGLVHYRRFFSRKKRASGQSKKWKEYVSNRAQIEKILQNTDVILPRKRNYFIFSLYEHYGKTHYIEHLDITEQIIKKDYSEYAPAFERIKKRRSAHMFNMMIMKKELYNQYCEWLFDILEKLEQQIDSSQYDDFQKRLYGRVSELLLDVWVETNQIHYVEIPTMMIGKVAWGRKVVSFIRAKLFKKKYKKSF